LLPPGWRGKTWACWNGAQAASHPTLLFLDADTWFEPRGLAAILDRFTEQPTALSVLPFHVVRKPYEQFSAFFQLVMAAGSAAFILPRPQPAGLFGQTLLIDRDLYLRAGGHEAVKAEILENFHLARMLRRENTPFRCLAGKHAVSMRMYPHGMQDLIEGWSKAFAAGAAKTPRFILALVIAWLSGLVMIAVSLFQFPGLLSLALYFFAVLQVHVLLRRLGTFAFYGALLYPIPLLAYFLLFARALTRRQVTWKGRTFNPAA
jgi:4,4'-diaponeurosporenoate glycosyltransferase